MEDIPAMNLWDNVMDIVHPQGGGDSKPFHQTPKPKHDESFGDIDSVPPNARF